LLKDIKPAGNNLTSSGGRKVTLPQGITHKQSHFFQTMASNPEIVEQVKIEAAENDGRFF
jgi:hypothetical protein